MKFSLLSKRNKEKMILSSQHGGKYIINKVYSTDSFQSFFAFSQHKSGSTLLTNILNDYCSQMNVRTLNIPDYVFQKGMELDNINIKYTTNFFSKTGTGYIGWRSIIPNSLQINLSDYKNILLVRDPRDRLVSLYFSLAFSHIQPKKGIVKTISKINREETKSFFDINHWVLNNKKFINYFNLQLNKYHNNLPHNNSRIYRYEDIIMKKEDWLYDMISYLNLGYNDKIVKKVITNNHIIPISEDQNNHVRQVLPGNYIKHLSTESINFLNEEFKAYLNKYNYLSPDKFGNKIIYAQEGIETEKLFL